MSKSTHNRRRPRWGRIFGVFLAFALCMSAAIFLPRLLRGDSPSADDDPLPAQSGSQGADAPQDAPDSGSAAESVVIPAGAAPADDPDALTAVSGYRSYTTAVTQTGLYEGILTADGTSCRLAYVDCATGQERWLCADPDCRHDSESCAAWLPANDVRLFANDSCLFAVIRPSEAEPYTLYRINPDGSGRQLLYTFAANEALTLTVALNEQQLFFVTSVSQVLRRLDLATGAVETIDDAGAVEDIAGAFDHYLVLSEHLPVDSENLASYYTLDVQTGEKDTFFTLPNSDRDRVDCCSAGRSLYLFERQADGNVDLYTLDIPTKEKTLLAAGLPFEEKVFTWGDGSVAGMLRCYLQPRVGGTWETYGIDRADGQMAQVSLQMADGEYVHIHGLYGDRFLVRCGSREIGEQQLQLDGGSRAVTVTRSILALISKEDFWAGNPNYQYIDTSLTE